MIDPTGLRAAAARAREAGGVVRAVSELADLVERFCDQIGEPRTEWAAAYSNDQGSGVLPRDDEQDARDFIASMPTRVRHHWHLATRTATFGPWVEVPGD